MTEEDEVRVSETRLQFYAKSEFVLIFDHLQCPSLAHSVVNYEYDHRQRYFELFRAFVTTPTSQRQRNHPKMLKSRSLTKVSHQPDIFLQNIDRLNTPYIVPISSCPAGTMLAGVNYLKGQPPVLAKPDEEYPSWLWDLLKPKVFADMSPGSRGEKALLRKANKQGLKEQNFLKTQ